MKCHTVNFCVDGSNGTTHSICLKIRRSQYQRVKQSNDGHLLRAFRSILSWPLCFALSFLEPRDLHVWKQISEGSIQKLSKKPSTGHQKLTAARNIVACVHYNRHSKHHVPKESRSVEMTKRNCSVGID